MAPFQTVRKNILQYLREQPSSGAAASSERTTHRSPSRKRKGSLASSLLLFHAKLRFAWDVRARRRRNIWSVALWDLFGHEFMRVFYGCPSLLLYPQNLRFCGYPISA